MSLMMPCSSSRSAETCSPQRRTQPGHAGARLITNHPGFQMDGQRRLVLISASGANRTNPSLRHTTHRWGGSPGVAERGRADTHIARDDNHKGPPAVALDVGRRLPEELHELAEILPRQGGGAVAVRPGLTGLARAHGRGHIDRPERRRRVGWQRPTGECQPTRRQRRMLTPMPPRRTARRAPAGAAGRRESGGRWRSRAGSAGRTRGAEERLHHHQGAGAPLWPNALCSRRPHGSHRQTQHSPGCPAVGDSALG